MSVGKHVKTSGAYAVYSIYAPSSITLHSFLRQKQLERSGSGDSTTLDTTFLSFRENHYANECVVVSHTDTGLCGKPEGKETQV